MKLSNKILIGLSVIAITSQCNALEIIKYNGDIAYLPLSSHSANRIIFPSPVVAKVFSKEKGVNIVEKGNEIYVKWTPVVTTTSEVDQNGQIMPVEEPKIDYTKAKIVDLFVTTENGTYSLVLQPSNIPQETVVISNSAEDQKKSIEFETKDPYMETMKKLVNAGFDLATETPNGDLANFKIEKLEAQQSTHINGFLDASPKAKLTGALFSIYLFEVKNNSNKTQIMSETAFNRLQIPKKLAISLYTNELFPYQRTALVIVVRNTTASEAN